MVHILIAEDDADVSAVLARIFRRAGWTVSTADDGLAALRSATANRPDVVLTDLDMPTMNGLQLCQAIRADPALRDTPVALLSGSLLPGDPRALEAGACAALLKPFTRDGLLAAVRDLLQRGRHDHTADPSTCPLVNAAATAAA